jgi:hypothetical protein
MRGTYRIPDNRRARVCACGQHGFVLLTKGFVALFSPERLPEVAPFRWCARVSKRRTHVYAGSQINGRLELMHRHLAVPAAGQEVDHRDGNGLNNFDKNLRPCSHQQNTWNQRPPVAGSSQFKGVSRAGNGKWQAHIKANGVNHALGVFEDEVEAARTYDAAAVSLHGGYARTNADLGLIERVTRR